MMSQIYVHFLVLFLSIFTISATAYPMSIVNAPPKGGIVVTIIGGFTTEIPTEFGEVVNLELRSPSGRQLAVVSISSNDTPWVYTGSLQEQGNYVLIVSKPSGNERYTVSIE